MLTIVNRSTRVSNADTLTMARACAMQLWWHIGPAWKKNPVPVVFATTPTAAPPGSVVIGLVDTTDEQGALGWHDEGPNDVEYGEIAVSPVLDNGGDALTKPLSVASVLSHEVGEWFCLAPQTRVLTRDLVWKQIGDVVVGETLVGFDEETGGPGHKRRYRPSIVERAEIIRRPSWELTLEDGTMVVASAEHRWLVNNGGRAHWVKTENLRELRGHKIASRIIKPLDVWGDPSTFEEGYIGGALDGEGCLSQHNSNGGIQTRVTFSQNDNSMLELVRRYLKEMGIEWSEFADTRREKDHHRLYISHKRDVLSLLGRTRPMRLLNKLNLEGLGCMLTDPMNAPAVVEKRYLGETEVVALTTSTGTFIAEGLASHNCDPHCNLFADTGQGFAVAYEIADPVENDSYLIQVGGTRVTVSNFVTPAWFDPQAKPTSSFDYLGRVHAPFQMDPGGYYVKLAEGQASQVFGERYPEWRKATKDRPSGRGRRLVQRANAAN